MAKIRAIEVTQHRIALEPPFLAAWDSRPRTGFAATIVRVSDDEGRVGIAGGEPLSGLAGCEDLFLGRDPLDLDRHGRIVDNLSFHYGRLWPLECALWDLAGKIRQQPVYRLLGGLQTRLPLYASTGSLRSAGEAADAAERIAEAGFKAMKIRFHRDEWRDDIAIVAAVRARIGERLELMVDCNQGWRMPWDPEDPWPYETALDVARELSDLGVYWMEEPLQRGDYVGMARLREAAGVRIAGGEMTREWHEFEALHRYGCLDVYQPDVVLTLGIGGLRRLGDLVRQDGLAVTPHTWGNGLGLLANAHAAAAVGLAPYLEFPFDPPEWSPARRDFMLVKPIEADADGMLSLSEAPGLGIELDEDRLWATRVG